MDSYHGGDNTDCDGVGDSGDDGFDGHGCGEVSGCNNSGGECRDNGPYCEVSSVGRCALGG